MYSLADPSKKWWEQPNADNIYASYKVGETEVLIGPTPDWSGFTPERFRSINAWLSVDDAFLEYPISANHRWIPWSVSDETPTKTTIFGTLKILHHWIDQLKLKRIYLHCAHGQQRAPTAFVSYLYAYHLKEMDNIIENKVVVGYPQWIDPRDNLKADFYQIPALPDFLRAVAQEGSELFNIQIPLIRLSVIKYLETQKKIRKAIRWAFHWTKAYFQNLFRSNKHPILEGHTNILVNLAKVQEILEKDLILECDGLQLKVSKDQVLSNDTDFRVGRTMSLSILRNDRSYVVKVRELGYTETKDKHQAKIKSRAD